MGYQINEITITDLIKLINNNKIEDVDKNLIPSKNIFEGKKYLSKVELKLKKSIFGSNINISFSHGINESKYIFRGIGSISESDFPIEKNFLIENNNTDPIRIIIIITKKMVFKLNLKNYVLETITKYKNYDNILNHLSKKYHGVCSEVKKNNFLLSVKYNLYCCADRSEKCQDEYITEYLDINQIIKNDIEYKFNLYSQKLYNNYNFRDIIVTWQ